MASPESKQHKQLRKGGIKFSLLSAVRGDALYWALCLVFGETRLKKKTKNPSPAGFGICFGSTKFLIKRRRILTHKKEENSDKLLALFETAAVG